MASYHEPMDVDEVLDSDDKENVFRHYGPDAPARTPNADKGYDELDISELDMRLRLSCTPLASPTPPPRRLTGSSKILFLESGDNSALNETITNDSANVTMTDWSVGDHNGNNSERDSLNSTVTMITEYSNKNSTDLLLSSDCIANNNATITLDISQNDNMSAPTDPITITPGKITSNKEPPKTSTSPIMRGLKSVLSMFRPSQSPITPADSSLDAANSVPQDVNPVPKIDQETCSKLMSVSTPVQNESETKKLTDQRLLKGSSPHNPDSIVFNEDLVNDLQWNEDTTIIFNKNKLPLRKLYTPLGSSFESCSRDSFPSAELIQEDIDTKEGIQESAPFIKLADTSVEYMDISMNDSNIHGDQTVHPYLDNEMEKQAQTINREYIQTLVENILESVFENAEKAVNECSSTILDNFNGDKDKLENDVESTINLTVPRDKTFTQVTDMWLQKETSDYSLENSTVPVLNSETPKMVDQNLHNITEKNEANIILNENYQTESLSCILTKPNQNADTSLSLPVEESKAQICIYGNEIVLEQEKKCAGNIIRKSLKSEQAEENVVLYQHIGEISSEENIESIEKSDETAEQKGNLVEEEIITSESTSPYTSLNAPSEQKNTEKLPVVTISELNFNIIDIPFDKKSHICESSPQIETSFDKIENPFATRSRVTMSPPCVDSNDRVTGKNDVQVEGVAIVELSQPVFNENDQNLKSPLKETGEELSNSTDLSKFNETPTEEKSRIIAINDTNHTSMEYEKELIIENTKNEIVKEDLTLALESISSSTLNGSDIIQIAESQEHSDDYLSADSSGRESEQLLEHELEMIDKNRENQTNINTYETESNIENTLETKTIVWVSPELNEVPAVAISDFYSENPFATKTKISVSPPLPGNSSSQIPDEAIINNENLFETTSKEVIVSEMADISGVSHSAEKVKPPEHSSSEMCEAKCEVKLLSKTEEVAVKETSATEIENTTTITEINSSPKCSKVLDLPNKEAENPFETKIKIRMSPIPQDPVINVADCENPFATKTKIRMSPPLRAGAENNVTETEFYVEELALEKSTPTNMIEQVNKLDENIRESKINVDKTSPSATSSAATKMRNSLANKTPITPKETALDIETVSEDVKNPFATKSKIRVSPPATPSFKQISNDAYDVEDLRAGAENNVTKTEFYVEELTLEKSTPTNMNEQVHKLDENIHESKINIEKTPSSAKTKKSNSLANKTPITPKETASDIEAVSFVDVENPFATKNKIRVSPPATPSFKPISNDAYALEDPFATKTKICMSPPLLKQNHAELPIKASPVKIQTTPDTSKLGKLLKTEQNICVLTTMENDIAVKMEEHSTKVNEISPETKTNVSKTPSSAKSKKKAVLAKKSPIIPKETPSHLDATFYADIADPFTTKSKIRVSPPATPSSNDSHIHEDPFATQSKIRMTPPLSHPNEFAFVPISEPNIDFTKSKEEAMDVSIDQTNSANNTVVCDNKINNTIEIKAELLNNVQITKQEQSPISEGDATVSSTGSNLSQNVTVKEVKTEDEDTIEGPDFVDLDDGENPIETKSTIRISTPVFDNKVDAHKTPQVIMCSDIEPAQSCIEDLVPDDEFLECNNEEFKPGELFINADTFDFLMNQNPAPGGTDHGKESLFLKFDPLCANRRNSNGVAAALMNVEVTRNDNHKCQQPETILEEGALNNNNATATPPIDKGALNNNNATPPIDNAIDTPTNVSVTPAPMHSYFPEPTTNNREQHSFIAANTTSPEKPVLAVSPAVNDQHINLRSTPYTPTRPERRSITFASPAIAAIDRLISLSGNNSPGNQTYYMDNTVPSQETNEAIIQMRELLAEKEAEVDQLRLESKMLQDRLTDLEIHMKSLQEENEERLKKINELKSKLAHKTSLNKNMATAVEEYERAISGMIGENDQEKQRHEKEKANLVRERDEQMAHLNSMEVSFSDLHTKYERTKQIILTYKANEEALRKGIEEYKESQQKLENNYEILKQQTLSKLKNANMEFDKLKRSHEAEVVKLNAQIKRKELHVTSLEESLTQKIKANEELTAICDELISKVG